MFHVKRFLLIVFLIPTLTHAQHFGATTLTTKPLPNLPARSDSIDKFLKSNPTYHLLNPVGKDWFYWTNYSRNNPKRFWDSIVSPILKVYPNLKNSYTSSLEKDLTTSPPLPLLSPNESLISTSESLAKELAESNSSPSHTSPSGIAFPERMKSKGIKNCAGENISYGPPNPVLMLVLLYIDQGVPQLGHRKSLLNPSFVEMGIGDAVYKNNNTIIIQDFACKQQ